MSLITFEVTDHTQPLGEHFPALMFPFPFDKNQTSNTFVTFVLCVFQMTTTSLIAIWLWCVSGFVLTTVKLFLQECGHYVSQRGLCPYLINLQESEGWCCVRESGGFKVMLEEKKVQNNLFKLIYGSPKYQFCLGLVQTVYKVFV